MQLDGEWQSHSGAVSGTTPKVQYAYADAGSGSNTVRPISTTYPSGWKVNYSYGSSGSLADATSRMSVLLDNDGTTHLVDYYYLGLGTTVEVDLKQPQVRWTLEGFAGGNDPDTGDIYRGLDRFGRVKDLVWRDYGSNVDLVRIKHGYDRASNRLYREDPVAIAAGKGFEELYGYDASYRLAKLNRGTLNAGKTAITSQTFGQCWTLDTTGNWKGFRQDDNGDGTWDLVQSRTANAVNEITGITNTTGSAWAAPVYNAVGNMTTMPQAIAMGSSFTGTYDAWNRLAKLADGANTVQENAYDGFNRRTVKKRYAGGVLAGTRHYYYSAAWQVLEERFSTTPDTASAEVRYVYGPRYIDDVVLRDRDTNADGTMDDRKYVLQDPNWNVVALADTNGDVQERYAYDAYGQVTVLTPTYGPRAGASYAWNLFYAAYRQDGESGLYQVRNRFYHPGVGVWVGRDPLGSAESQNLYEYVHAWPIGYVDPFGLGACDRIRVQIANNNRVIKSWFLSGICG